MEQSIKSVLVKQTIAHQQQQLTNLQVRDPLRCSLCLVLSPAGWSSLRTQNQSTALACPQPATSACFHSDVGTDRLQPPEETPFTHLCKLPPKSHPFKESVLRNFSPVGWPNAS